MCDIHFNTSYSHINTLCVYCGNLIEETIIIEQMGDIMPTPDQVYMYASMLLSHYSVLARHSGVASKLDVVQHTLICEN